MLKIYLKQLESMLNGVYVIESDTYSAKEVHNFVKIHVVIVRDRPMFFFCVVCPILILKI